MKKKTHFKKSTEMLMIVILIISISVEVSIAQTHQTQKTLDTTNTDLMFIRVQNGLGFKVVLKNTGSSTIQDINWHMSIVSFGTDRPYLEKESEGQIASLGPGEKTIIKTEASSGGVHGLSASAWIGDDLDSKIGINRYVFVFGPFVLVFPNCWPWN